MLKKIINFIFIYILSLTFVGCDLICFPDRDGGYCGDWTSNQDTFYENYDEGCGDYCVLELSIRDTEIQEDGYYHIDYYNGSDWTYAYVDAYVGHGYEYIGWSSNIEHCFEWNGTITCDDAINGSSYSGSDFMATAVLGVTEQNIGDVVKIYCGYYDDWGVQYLDSLEVIIDE